MKNEENIKLVIHEYHALAPSTMLTKIGKDLIWHIGEKAPLSFEN